METIFKLRGVASFTDFGVLGICDFVGAIWTTDFELVGVVGVPGWAKVKSEKHHFLKFESNITLGN